MPYLQTLSYIQLWKRERMERMEKKMTTLIEELEHYRKFAREVMDEDCGLEVWTRPEFEGIKLIAEVELAHDTLIAIDTNEEKEGP